MKKKKLMSYMKYIAPLLFLVILGAVYMIWNMLNKVEIENQSLYQYLAGQKFEYEGRLEFKRDGAMSRLTFQNREVNLDSTPLYYQKQKKVIFPKKMAVVYPLEQGIMYKLNPFSIVAQNQYGTYLVQKKKEQKLDHCFLYDGEDLYFFFEDVTLQLNDQQVIVPAFSYVSVHYQQSIEIYNYEKDLYQNIGIGSRDIIAIHPDYRINLSIDALTMNAKDQLLIKNIDYLKNLLSHNN